MEQNCLTVSIGIPAYNEEGNIKYLLQALLRQREEGYVMREIIVVSDGCTDRTVEYVEAIEDDRIKLVANTRPRGKASAQNQIVQFAQGDILVLLDADVLPISDNFITAIISPIMRDKAVGLVGAATLPAAPRGFFEQIIAESHEFKQRIYTQIKKGNNLYLCHGRARAVARRFYTQLTWPAGYSEDAYSYFFCTQQGFKFRFTPRAQVVFRSPSRWQDHVMQSLRFSTSKQRIAKYFAPVCVEREYYLPPNLVLQTLGSWLLRKPLMAVCYLFIFTLTRIFSFVTCWSEDKVSLSTKILIHEN